MGSSRGPEGAFADGGRGLKPIPEDAMRPSMEANNGAGGASDAGAQPAETVSLCLLYLPQPLSLSLVAPFGDCQGGCLGGVIMPAKGC